LNRADGSQVDRRPRSRLASLDATLTPPTAQHPATGSYSEQENPLKYAGSSTSGNTRQRLLPPLQGGLIYTGIADAFNVVPSFALAV
jgi:hypothetical protein